VYDLRFYELQIILDFVKQNKTGSKQLLRSRVLNMLSDSSSKTKALRQQIVKVYKARPDHELPQPQMSQILPKSQSSHQPSHQSQQVVPRYLHVRSYNNATLPSHNLQPFNETPPTPIHQFEHLPFFKTIQILLMPMYCRSSIETTNFFLTDNVRHSIVKSWNIIRQEYKIQVILRLVQVGLKENVVERLPYNISVSVNDRPCKLPILNIPIKADIIPWRCNVPIDITQQTDLKNSLQNTLKITWAEEPHEYIAAVFVAQKLTWSELLVELNKRPLRASEKTKELIKKSIESDDDMGVDYMFANVKDPLSKTKMKLPARGMDCTHIQCFDAIQFLQMNEHKQTWACPLCKKNVKFEDIEVDEFFLNILQSSNLSTDSESIILLQDGSWTERKSISNTPNSKESNNQIEVFTLSDSDDDGNVQPKEKRLKLHSKIEEPVLVKSEHIIEIGDVTQTNNPVSTENDLLLDLSLKNSTSIPASTSSSCRPVKILNDDSDVLPSVE